jgi:hypothetical protein
MDFEVFHDFEAFKYIFLGDFSVFFGGILAGMLVMILRQAYISARVYYNPKMKEMDVNIARIKDKSTGKEFIYWNHKRNFIEALEVKMNYEWWSWTGRRKDYILPNKRSQLQIYIGTLIVISGIILYGLYNMFHVQLVPVDNTKDLYDAVLNVPERIENFDVEYKDDGTIIIKNKDTSK